MKHNTDTEMDLLFRRHARRDAQGVRQTPDARREEEAVRKSHLDADELSAYAEGAVPEAMRLRYAAHLADCDDCRKIVTGIVISSGAEVEEKPGVVEALSEPRRSWREWLAAIFAPPVLRYAVPALALASVIAIVLVVARRDREDFVAKNEQAQQATSNASAERQAPTGTYETTNTSSANSENHGVLPTTATANTSSDERAKTGEGPAQAQPKPSDADRTARNVQEEGTTDTSTGTKLADAPQPSVAAAPTTSSEVSRADDYRRTEPSAPSNAPAEADTTAGKAKEKDENQLAAQKNRERQRGEFGAGATGTAGGRAQQREDKSSGADVVGGVNESVAVNKRQPSTAARKATPPASRAARDSADDEGAETRVVAGRTFRRQGSVWVDSAYNSSGSVTKVRRGSEQYRALVADEPVVGTVANALGGDVILVVRSRAYRLY